jgi:hypothetical protein
MLAAVPASAQQLMATMAMATESTTVMPGTITSEVLFPVASVARAAETALPPVLSTRSSSFDGRRPGLLPAMYASAVLLQALDAHSTMTAIGRGAHEANPVMTGVAKNRGALIAVKAGVAASTIYLAEKMWRRNRVGAIALMAIINSVDAAIVAHNYRVASQLR